MHCHLGVFGIEDVVCGVFHEPVKVLALHDGFGCFVELGTKWIVGESDGVVPKLAGELGIAFVANSYHHVAGVAMAAELLTGSLQCGVGDSGLGSAVVRADVYGDRFHRFMVIRYR